MPPRISHNSEAFYRRRLYTDGAPALQEAALGEQALPEELCDRIFCADARSMDQIPDRSIHLIVTSPPYNVGKAYDADLSLQEYLDLLEQVMREGYRVLTPGGRVCVNIANVGRKPYVPLASYVTLRMLELGFVMRGEIIWDKGASAGVSMAWGSFASAANPVLRDVHEYILVFSRPPMGRPGKGRRSTIRKEDFMAWTKSIWSFPAESARRVGHPAPFPIELPRRLIELYTFEGDVVLDPFIGSGTTAVAAVLTGRHFVGYDIVPEYVELARRRVEAVRQTMAEGGSDAHARSRPLSSHVGAVG